MLSLVLSQLPGLWDRQTINLLPTGEERRPASRDREKGPFSVVQGGLEDEEGDEGDGFEG